MRPDPKSLLPSPIEMTQRGCWLKHEVPVAKGGNPRMIHIVPQGQTLRTSVLVHKIGAICDHPPATTMYPAVNFTDICIKLLAHVMYKIRDRNSLKGRSYHSSFQCDASTPPPAHWSAEREGRDDTAYTQRLTPKWKKLQGVGV